MDIKSLNEETVAAIKQMKLVEVALLIKQLESKIDDLAKDKNELQKVLDHLQFTVAPQMMEDQGIDRVTFEGVGRMQLKDDIYCSCPAANSDELKDWLVANGHAAMVNETVNSSSLKAFVKEQMKSGGAYPSGLLKITPFTKASVVKA